jgi:hypothetical protein
MLEVECCWWELLEMYIFCENHLQASRVLFESNRYETCQSVQLREAPKFTEHLYFNAGICSVYGSSRMKRVASTALLQSSCTATSSAVARGMGLCASSFVIVQSNNRTLDWVPFQCSFCSNKNVSGVPWTLVPSPKSSCQPRYTCSSLTQTEREQQA